MSKFIDGPAGGVSLHLRRSPILLRVVRNKQGVWDALDQLTDMPEPGETIYLYRLCSEVTRGFMCVRGGKGGGAFSIGHYRFVSPQPGDEQMRTSKAWNAWCEANKERQLEFYRLDCTSDDQKGGA